MTLISEQTYRKLTGDLRSSVSDVVAALVVAQGLVEMRLGRALSLGEYTETLAVYPDYSVYPSVTPLDDTQEGYIDSVTLRVGYVDTYDSVGLAASSASPRATVTYTGGYDDETLPQALATAICLIAKQTAGSSGVLAVTGAKSVSIGDLSVTYDRPVHSTWPAGVWDLVSPYRKRQVVPT